MVVEYVQTALARLNDDQAILPTARLLPNKAADQAIRHFGYDRVRNALLKCQDASKVDHIALMRIFGPFPPDVQSTLKASNGVNFHFKYSGDEELREQTPRVLKRDLEREQLSGSGAPVSDVTILLTVEALSGSYRERSAIPFIESDGKTHRRYTGARFSAELRVVAGGQTIFSLPIEGHSSVQDIVGADSFSSKASAPVYGAVENATLYPVLYGLGRSLTIVRIPASNDLTEISSHNENSEEPAVGPDATLAELKASNPRQIAKLAGTDLGSPCRAAKVVGRSGDPRALDVLVGYISSGSLAECPGINGLDHLVGHQQTCRGARSATELMQ